MLCADLVLVGDIENYSEGFCPEDQIDLPIKEGTDVISPLRVTNIPKPESTLTIEVGEKDSDIPEAS